MRIGISSAFLLALLAFVPVKTTLAQPGASPALSAAEAEAKQAKLVREQRFQTIWKDAEASQNSKDLVSAERKYAAIVSEFPKSQRAALRLAVVRGKQGKFAESKQDYDKAIALDPTGEWAPVGLFYKARLCGENHDTKGSADSLRELYRLHPDSSYIAQGKLLEAKAKNRNVEQAEADLKRELDGAARYDTALDLSKLKKDDEAIAALQGVQRDFAGTAASLRARESRAHLLVRNKRFGEAEQEFQFLCQKLEALHADSRIYQTAKTRLAALRHAVDDKEGALRIYYDLASTGKGAAAENATLQAAALEFELLQQKRWKKEEITEEDWKKCREFLMEVSAIDTYAALNRCLADLMLLETYYWQHDYAKAVELGEAFIAKYDEKEFRREVATAHWFTGECCLEIVKPLDAIIHAEKVLELYPTEQTIWSGCTHLPRTYLIIWCACQELKKTPQHHVEAIRKRDAAREQFQRRFPDEKGILEWMNWDARTNPAKDDDIED